MVVHLILGHLCRLDRGSAERWVSLPQTTVKLFLINCLFSCCIAVHYDANTRCHNVHDYADLSSTKIGNFFATFFEGILVDFHYLFIYVFMFYTQRAQWRG